GRSPSVKSDQFSLAVMSYYLLTRQLPYGTELARCKTEKKLKKVRYHSLSEYRPDLPKGLDAIFKKALSIRPEQRYEALSAFIYDLKQPDLELKKSVSRPVIERHPLTFWKCCTAILFILLLLVFSLYFMKQSSLTGFELYFLDCQQQVRKCLAYYSVQISAYSMCRF